MFYFTSPLHGALPRCSRNSCSRPPAELAATYEPVADVDVPHMTSWADEERDLSQWLGNAMQSNALHELYKLEGALRERNDPELLTDWRRLTSSNHFYYMYKIGRAHV